VTLAKVKGTSVGQWPCWTCWCQRNTCSDSCVRHWRVNKREGFDL